MIIGIDGNEANETERVGVHQYTFELLWALYKLQDTISDDSSFVIYLKNRPLLDLPLPREGWKYKIIGGGRIWVLSRLMPTLLFREKVDVFFSPGHYLPFFTRSPKVFTIHDLGYLKFSGQFGKYDFWQLKVWTAISAIISKYIIVPSKSTAIDIVRHYSFARQKIKVVYHGYNFSKFNKKISRKFVRQVTEKYRIPGKYLLFLSTLKPSKNIEGLLTGFKYLKSERIDGARKVFKELVLVIAGKKGWMYKEIFSKVKELHLEKDIIFTDYVEENDKPALMAGAEVFILPSFWEGFGMDVLNSLACGIPTVVSNVASLPEVAGKAGIYIDPYDPNSIAAGIEEALTMDDVEYRRQVKFGLDQVKNFSWEKAARETLDILKLSRRA